MESPQPRICISPMSLETVQAVEQLEQECFSTPWSLDALAEELSNPLAVFYVATVDDTVVGYAGMHHIIDEGYITNVAVTAGFRRKGVATALLDALLDYAKQHDMQMLTLEVRASNDAALALYSALKFEQTGTRKAYYRGPTEDALILTRDL